MKMSILKLNLTSNNSNGCDVSSSPVFNNKPTNQPYNVFDNIITNTVDEPCYHSTNTSDDKYILLKLSKPTKLVSLLFYTRYSWWYTLKTFSVYGSNNGSTFTLLKTVDASGWVTRSNYSVNFQDNTNEYLYYKFVANSTSYFTCLDIILYEKAKVYGIKDEINNTYNINNTMYDCDSNTIQSIYTKDKFVLLSDIKNANTMKNNFKIIKIK